MIAVLKLIVMLWNNVREETAHIVTMKILERIKAESSN